MKTKSLLALLLALSVVMSGCASSPVSSEGETAASDIQEVSPAVQTEPTDTETTPVSMNPSELFSDRDYDTDYEDEKSAQIQLNGSSASCDSDAVQISGTTVTITEEGSYILTGTLDDGMIIVNAEKTDKIRLVLNGVRIESQTSAPIYILQADKVIVTTAEKSENILSNGGTFTAIDENNIDAVIFSKEDLTLNGTGSLIITSPAGHGIVSKDSLTVTGGSYDINCSSHALSGKDDVSIAGGSFVLVSGKDGIHAENADDPAAGTVYIGGGSYEIQAEGDGISAASNLQIDGGTFEITTGGGSVNAEQKTSENWGGFMGGGKHGDRDRGHAGPMENMTPPDQDGMPEQNTEASTDSTSIKAIKAGTNLTVNGGIFFIDSADDSVHSNGNVSINAGDFEIASGDDAFHAEESLTISAGSINISTSYEGLEGLHVLISGGTITLVSSDDGLNAAGGTDFSGFNGGRDGMFGPGVMGSPSSGGSISITGGTLHVTASGDGLDANGTIEISGGMITVCGPNSGDTATLDYDSTAEISGGTFIGTGAMGMAQTFSDSSQGVIAVSVGNLSAGTQIKLTDSQGNSVIEYTAPLNFSVVILSSPDMIKGENYTISVGSNSADFTAN